MQTQTGPSSPVLPAGQPPVTGTLPIGTALQLAQQPQAKPGDSGSIPIPMEDVGGGKTEKQDVAPQANGAPAGTKQPAAAAPAQPVAVPATNGDKAAAPANGAPAQQPSKSPTGPQPQSRTPTLPGTGNGTQSRPDSRPPLTPPRPPLTTDEMVKAIHRDMGSVPTADRMKAILKEYGVTTQAEMAKLAETLAGKILSGDAIAQAVVGRLNKAGLVTADDLEPLARRKDLDDLVAQHHLYGAEERLDRRLGVIIATVANIRTFAIVACALGAAALVSTLFINGNVSGTRSQLTAVHEDVRGIESDTRAIRNAVTDSKGRTLMQAMSAHVGEAATRADLAPLATRADLNKLPDGDALDKMFKRHEDREAQREAAVKATITNDGTVTRNHVFQRTQPLFAPQPRAGR